MNVVLIYSLMKNENVTEEIQKEFLNNGTVNGTPGIEFESLEKLAKHAVILSMENKSFSFMVPEENKAELYKLLNQFNKDPQEVLMSSQAKTQLPEKEREEYDNHGTIQEIPAREFDNLQEMAEAIKNSEDAIPAVLTVGDEETRLNKLLEE